MGPNTPGHLCADTHRDIVCVRRQGGPDVPHGLFLNPSTNGSSIVRPIAWAAELSDLPLQCWQLVKGDGYTSRDVHVRLFVLC